MHSPPESASGIGRYVRELHRHLSHQLMVHLVRPIDPPLARRLSFLHHLALGLQDHRPGSIVHFTQVMGCAMMLWRPVHPAVATVYDLGPLELADEWGMLDPLARQILWLSLRGLKRVEAIVAVSEFTRQSVIRHLAVEPERVVAIHPGVDTALFRPIPAARGMLAARYPSLPPSRGHWLLYVGSELPRKNLRTLLEAVARLKPEWPDLHLIKVGAAGGARFRQATLDDIRALGLEAMVSMFEGVTDDDLPLFYAAADLLVTASRLEGFGLPVLEAMACGTPVVCSNSASLPEVVGDAAMLVDAKDPVSLGKSMATVLGDAALRREMSERGLARAQQLTWDGCADQLVELYRRWDGPRR